MKKGEARKVEVAIIQPFEKTESQLEGFFVEVGSLAKKKPDDSINEFKLKYINQMLVNANALLGVEYRPFPDFDKFDVESLPSTSDVTIILSQYLRSMDKYRKDHTTKGLIALAGYFWNVEAHSDEYPAKSPKHFD